MTGLREIFQARFGSYAKEHKLPHRSYQAANAIMSCRTAAMGGHAQQCENGHVAGVHYNSCRHRSCPLCNERNKTQWADAQAARLLACDHYHVIFTLPHELLDWWSFNRQVLADLLFASATDALLALLQDKRHLGATPGVVSSLHTWGRTLSRHPHVHCLVTGGGLTTDGQWRATHNGYLLPVRVLRPVYRGKFMAGLEQLLKSGELRLPEGVTAQSAFKLLRTIAQKEWNVRIQERYAHGRGVMQYLGRYVRGGPISDRQLLNASERHVCFRYRDHRDGKSKVLALDPSEFISRVLWHVPETGRHTTRYYGLYSHKARAKRAVCREQLGQAAEPPTPEPVDWQTFLEQAGHSDKTHCRQCGARLRSGPAIPRVRKNPISIGACQLRRQPVQQDDQADREQLRTRSGPPREPEIFFCAEDGRLSKR